MLRIKFIITIFQLIFFQSFIFSQKNNQFDSNGKRTGVWIKYYDNGNIRYSGAFKAGKEIGVFKFYKKRNNFPNIIKEYSIVDNSAIVKFYNKYGKLTTKGKMIGKKREGKWVYFYSNGRKISEEEYLDGKLDGIMVNFYPNGKKTNVVHYKNGFKNGKSKTYSDDGVLIEDVNFVNGKLNGLAKYYNLKGVIQQEGIYENGNRKGKWEVYIDGKKSKKFKRHSYLNN